MEITKKRILLLVLVLLILILNIVRPLQFVLVSGVSMEPVMVSNDLAMINNLHDYENVDDGDVIVFNSGCGDYTVIHEVVEVTEDGLVTQGYNNNYTDQSRNCQPKVDKYDYIGRMMFHVETGELL